MEKRILTKVVASGLIWNRESVLLLKRARDFKGLSVGRGLWEPPGGVVDMAESIPECLRREVSEETGISITTLPVLAAVCHYTVEDAEVVAHRFHILYSVRLAAPANVRLSEEHADYCWVDSAARAAGLEMIPALSEIVHEAFSVSVIGRDRR